MELQAIGALSRIQMAVKVRRSFTKTNGTIALVVAIAVGQN
jgi:hypothetical protein